MIGAAYTGIAVITFLIALFVMVKGNPGVNVLTLSAESLALSVLWFIFWGAVIVIVYQRNHAPEPAPAPIPEPVIAPANKPRKPRAKKATA